MDQTAEELDVKQLLFILRKNWLLIIVSALVCTALGFAAAKWVVTPQYASSTMLVVNAASTQSTSNTITNDQLTTAQELVNTYSVILKSDTVLDQVISDLNLDTDAVTFAKNITVDGVDQTQVLKITVKNPNPQMARNIANDIARVAPNVIIKTVKAGSVDIVSDAKLNLKPVFPNVLLFSAVGLVIGLIASFLFFLIRELMDNTFDSDEDIKNRLGISVIGVIPVINEKL